MASPLRRQCIGLGLSELELDAPSRLAKRLQHGDHDGLGHADPLAYIAYVLLHCRVRGIIRLLHPDAVGLVGALSKLGAVPLSRRDYRSLVALHTEPEHRHRIAVLRHLTHIPRQRIPIILALPAPYLSLPVLQRVASVDQALDFERSIELIRRVIPTITDDELVRSLTALKPSTSIREWTRRWISKATQFWQPAPIFDPDEMIVLRDAATMRDAAKRFENCLEHKVAHCALGRVLFVEYLPGSCIIELECLATGWIFEGVYGPQNTAVDPETIRQVVQKLGAAGVHVRASHMQASRYNRVARLAGALDLFRDDIDLINDDLDDLAQEFADAA